MTEYLRKELKVPQYSNMYENQQEFEEDTDRIFAESKDGYLATKITQIKEILTVLLSLIKTTPEIKVSFGVFDGIKQLAESDIR